MDVYISISVSYLDLMSIVIIMKIGLNKPLGGKLNDSVELPLQGCRTFAHLNVLAVLSNWRVDLSLRPGLGLFQTQQFSGGGWHQQGFGPRQWVVTWWCRTLFIAQADATVGSGMTIQAGVLSNYCLYVPAPSRISVLSFVLKRTSTWLRMNSTTTDWIRTSIKAAVPLKHADSICLDLKQSWTNNNEKGRITLGLR